MNPSLVTSATFDRQGDDCPICGRHHRLEVDGGIRGASRILVAEDEPSVGRLIAYNLELDGHHVECVENGDAALERLVADPPDVLVLDLLLPLRSGWQVLRAIRARRESKIRDVPVLVISALACERLAQQLAPYGAAELLGKPFSVDELRRRVREMLEATRAGSRRANLHEKAMGGSSARNARPVASLSA